MPGLGQSFNQEEIIQDALLGMGLVFDNEIAAPKRCSEIHIWRNFASDEGSKTTSDFQEAEVGEEYGNTKRLSGYKSRMNKSVEWTQKGKKGQEDWRDMENK